MLERLKGSRSTRSRVRTADINKTTVLTSFMHCSHFLRVCMLGLVSGSRSTRSRAWTASLWAWMAVRWDHRDRSRRERRAH
eukprot:scaffold277922_cov14-Tisochrysis_lutea.AAC.1